MLYNVIAHNTLGLGTYRNYWKMRGFVYKEKIIMPKFCERLSLSLTTGNDSCVKGYEEGWFDLRDVLARLIY